MLVIVMEIRRMVVRMLLALMTVRMGVLADERRFVRMAVMPVVVTMNVIMVHGKMHVPMAMPLGDM